MKLTHYSLSIILLFIFGCKERAPEESFMTLSVSPNSKDELKLADIIESVEEIKLEETEESLITMITRVEATEDYLFVFDARLGTVLQFLKSGEFVKPIGKKGEGPEEVARAVSFTIDEINEEVYIAGMKTIGVYGFDGGYKRSIRGYLIPNYLSMDDGILEVFRTQTNKLADGSGFMKFPTRYRVEAETGKLIDSTAITKLSLKNEITFLVMDANYYSQASKNRYFYLPVLFPEPLVRDTLYLANGHNLKPTLKLDFGSEAMNEKGTKAVNIRSVFRSDRYLIAKYSHNRETKFFVYDFEANKGYNLVGGLDGGSYSDGEPVDLYPVKGKPNNFYFKVQKMDESVEGEPNPTVYLVELKQ